jgi:glycosyltransferase involved in cell wall biosynthesis
MQEQEINLSYFMTTFQKLDYLKIVLNDLIASRHPDEEIIIADGGSKDGTAEWLLQLYNEKKIQGFISAKDKGEAHGANRAVLLCRGKVLKWINDDDIFCYKAIRECKDFLLQNDEFDVVAGDGFDNYNGDNLELISHIKHFKKWQKEKEPFGFYGPGFMMRRSSLPLLGMFNCLSRFVDNEYTFRATSLPIKMAWYTRPVFVRVINPESNTLKFLKAKKVEEGLNGIYRKIATGRPVSDLKKQEIVNRVKRKVYDMIYGRSSGIKNNNYQITDIEALYKSHRQTLSTAFENAEGNAFIY